jgi:hypothetical protein
MSFFRDAIDRHLSGLERELQYRFYTGASDKVRALIEAILGLHWNHLPFHVGIEVRFQAFERHPRSIEPLILDIQPWNKPYELIVSFHIYHGGQIWDAHYGFASEELDQGHPGLVEMELESLFREVVMEFCNTTLGLPRQSSAGARSSNRSLDSWRQLLAPRTTAPATPTESVP